MGGQWESVGSGRFAYSNRVRITWTVQCLSDDWHALAQEDTDDDDRKALECHNHDDDDYDGDDGNCNDDD